MTAPSLELTAREPRPFVKWAGGKGSLVAAISERMDEGRRYRRYLEPFVGAGAVFFWIRRSFPHVECVIGDSNEELMNAYRAIRDHVHDVLAKLETHALLHGKEHYYAVRASSPRHDVERAARFIYLNRTCFNGLYRVNRRGRFNVPLGRYVTPRIVDRDNLLAASAALAGVELRAGDFEDITSSGGKGDLVYLDPPYDPLSATSHFTSYTRQGFGRTEQERLARAVEGLAQRGADVIVSNSDTPLIRELYEGLSPRPRIDVVTVRRAINSNPKRRGGVSELLIHFPRDRVP